MSQIFIFSFVGTEMRALCKSTDDTSEKIGCRYERIYLKNTNGKGLEGQIKTIGGGTSVLTM